MPNYDYQCQSCGHTFEVFQSMNDPKLTECPECSGVLERLIGTGAGMIFKGSGFYVTDYRSKSYQAAAKAEQGTDGKSAKGDSKSAVKPKPETPTTSKDNKAGGSASTSAGSA